MELESIFGASPRGGCCVGVLVGDGVLVSDATVAFTGTVVFAGDWTTCVVVVVVVVLRRYSYREGALALVSRSRE